MNVRWKVDGGETNLRKGSFGNTHETLSLSQRNDYYKALVFCLSQGWRLLFEVRSILHFSVASTLRQGFYSLQKAAVSSRSSRWTFHADLPPRETSPAVKEREEMAIFAG